MKAGKRKKQAQGAKDFAHHLGKALEAFGNPNHPLWKRTQNGMLAFKGLNMTHLPRRLERDMDRRFGEMNRILSHYEIETWEDYQNISEDDLLNLQDVIKGFATDA